MGKASRNRRNKFHAEESRLSLKPATEKRLSGYVSGAAAEQHESPSRNISACWLAVGAAGLGILACPSAAKANIVQGNGFSLNFDVPSFVGTANSAAGAISVGWDVDGDGITDFVGHAAGSRIRTGSCARAFVEGSIAGGFVGSGFLNKDFQIGPSDAFGGGVGQAFEKYGSFAVGSGGACRSVGGQSGRGSGYIGFRFLINGQFHYGWAFLDVSVGPGAYDANASQVFYNSIPNQPVFAGQTPEPGTLGLLALGALGLGFWRRKQLAST